MTQKSFLLSLTGIKMCVGFEGNISSLMDLPLVQLSRAAHFCWRSTSRLTASFCGAAFKQRRASRARVHSDTRVGRENIMLRLCVCNLEFLSAICSFLGKHGDTSSGATSDTVVAQGYENPMCT